jgi:hypothetical protein
MIWIAGVEVRVVLSINASSHRAQRIGNDRKCKRVGPRPNANRKPQRPLPASRMEDQMAISANVLQLTGVCAKHRE